MRGHGPPAIPALSDAAVARVERSLFGALDRGAPEAARSRAWHRARGHRALLAAGVAAAAVLAVVAARELRPGTGLPARGARIATARSPSHLTIPGAALDVAPDSAIDFAAERDGSVTVALERGAVTCEVAPRSPRAPFVVEAGATRVTVIGTRFTVARAGDHAAVSVEHGTVEVGDDGLTQILHAGERYLPPGDEPPPAPAPPPPPVAAPAPASPSAAPPHARRVATREDRPAGPSSIERFEAPPPEQPPPPVSPPREPSPPLPRAPDHRPAIDGPLQRRFEAAAALEVRDPAGALRIYEALAAGNDAWAANALFAAARLEAERGHRDRARALLGAYLQRFPGGPNGDDARALGARLQAGGDAPR